ncbi:MAG TPA: hypothetical protein VHX16_08115, partial [Chloroflexota bacterium]|nr:hypothetical protein [Chloroflexota bacterium]
DVGSLSSPTICGGLAAMIGLGAMLVSVPLGAVVVCFGVMALHRQRSPDVLATQPATASTP